MFAVAAARVEIAHRLIQDVCNGDSWAQNDDFMHAKHAAYVSAALRVDCCLERSPHCINVHA